MKKNLTAILKTIGEIVANKEAFYKKHPEIKIHAISLLCAFDYALNVTYYDEQDSMQLYFQPSRKNLKKRVSPQVEPRIFLYVYPDGFVEINIHRIDGTYEKYKHVTIAAAEELMKPELEKFYK